jgi:hypothetical protein
LEEETEVTNRSVVQILAKEDPMFDIFLKMSLRERPSGKRLIKGTAPSFLKAKIKRVAAPLGLSAVMLDPIPPKPQPQAIPHDNGDPSLMTNSRLDGLNSGIVKICCIFPLLNITTSRIENPIHTNLEIFMLY